MLPHSKEHLRVVLECIGQSGVMAVVADMRHIVNKLTQDLIRSEDERETLYSRGKYAP
jgi:hypothetical protein